MPYTLLFTWILEMTDTDEKQYKINPEDLKVDDLGQLVVRLNPFQARRMRELLREIQS